MIYFKLYGQMRTGTNYFLDTLERNFEDIGVLANIGGWKHGKMVEMPDEQSLRNDTECRIMTIPNTIDLFKNNKIYFIILVKNPYMWIHSMSKYLNRPITKEFVVEQITKWNYHYSDYKTYIQTEKAYLIKYETLLEHPIETLDKIKDKFNLTKKNEYTFQGKKLKDNIENERDHLNIDFDGSMYLNLNISNYLTNELIQTINDTIDRTLMDFYGYEMIFCNKS